jgi:hypothetical protein
MVPIEEMAFAQSAEVVGSHGPEGIEEAVPNVNTPRSAKEKQSDPGLQMHARSFRKGQRPHDRNSRRIEAGKVP